MGIFEGEKLRHCFKLSSRKEVTPDEFSLLMGGLMAREGLRGEDIEGVVGCSVVPPLTRVVKEGFSLLIGKEPLFMGEDFPPPIEILYDNPEEVGTDRLANAIACGNMYGKPGIVVDFGTAITFDVVSPKGEYMGGIIAPGVEIALQALFLSTARLPKVDIEVPKEWIGKTTREAIRIGVVWGTVGLVEELLNRVKEEIGEAVVVLTGGMGNFFAPQMKTSCFVDPYLTLEGLRIAWREKKSS